MKLLKAMSLTALLLLPLGVACSSSSGSKSDGGGGTGGNHDAGGGTGGAGGGGGAPDGGAGADGAIGTDGADGPAEVAIEFTDFVYDLITNKTAANNRPETIDDKVFKDSMNPAAFDPLFQ